MPTERERERERVHDLLALVQQGSALHSGPLLSFCRTVILRKTELFFIWIFLHWFSFVFLTERLLWEKTDLLPLNFSFTDCIFPRLAEPFLWKWNCPSTCGVFLHWISSQISTEMLSCKNTALIQLDFFGLMTILEHYLKEKVVIKNVKNFNHHDLYSPN